MPKSKPNINSICCIRTRVKVIDDNIIPNHCKNGWLSIIYEEVKELIHETAK